MREEQRKWLQGRIQALKQRQRRVGPFRWEGLQRTIEGMKQQLKEDVWNPPFGENPTITYPWSK